MNLQKNKYLLANLSAALASLTRPYGILLLLPIVSTYWQKKHCALKNWIALTLPLFALAGYMYYCYTQTGDSLLFLHSQTVWHKQFSWPWQSLWQPIHFIGYITPVEKLLSLLALLVLLIAFKFLPTPWVIWANLLNLIPLLSGTIISNARYMLLLWPLFVTLAIISLHKKSWYETSLAILLVLQTLLFSAWCQFYWVA